MNRELKVPAALAIMLVGFGAMVFWCGKPQDDAGAGTAHEDFSDIDAEIQDRPHTPHITGLESASDSPSLGQDTSAESASSDDEGWLNWLHDAEAADVEVVSSGSGSAKHDVIGGRPAAQNAGKLISSRPIYSSHSPEPVTGESTANAAWDSMDSARADVVTESIGRKDIPIPSPIQSGTPAATIAEAERQLNEGWDVVTPSASAEVLKKRLHTASTPQRTYAIQPGDTLSRIAAKFLGSSRRAAEIFEANRDVLRDPNQLSVGTVIVIPAEGDEVPAVPIEPDGPVAENGEPLRSARVSERESLFVPVSSSPLRNSVQTSGNDSKNDTGSERTPREYTVRRGDSLERISVMFYGTRTRAMDIFRTNAEKLPSPNSIREGMTLELP